MTDEYKPTLVSSLQDDHSGSRSPEEPGNQFPNMVATPDRVPDDTAKYDLDIPNLVEALENDPTMTQSLTGLGVIKVVPSSCLDDDDSKDYVKIGVAHRNSLPLDDEEWLWLLLQQPLKNSHLWKQFHSQNF